jgi:hypothetical protein
MNSRQLINLRHAECHFIQTPTLTLHLMKTSIVILTVLAFLNCSIVQAADYYVSDTLGKDSNTGLSVSKPFKTLNKAKQIALAGDTVHIMKGTYRNANYGNGKMVNNKSALQITRSGNASAGHITFKNYADHKPKIQYDGVGGISLASGVSYIVIDGLEIQGPSSMITYAEAFAKRQEEAGIGPSTGHSDNYYSSSGISGWGPHNNIIIRNCKVHEIPSSGIRFNRSDHIIIEDCIVSRCCWWTWSASSGIVFAETIAANGDNGKDIKMIIRRNIVSEVWNRIPFFVAKIPANGNPPRPDYGKPKQDYILDGQGIYVTRSNPQYLGTFLFENNICMNNGKNGINFDHSKSATALIRHNTMYHNGSHNFIQANHDGPNRVAGIAASGVAKAMIVNNIVVVRPPAKEVTQITCRADSSGNLNSTFFELEGASGRHRFWYSVNGGGAAPEDLGGGVHRISISKGDSNSTVAGLTQKAIDGIAGLTATNNDSVVVVNDEAYADRKNVTDNGATGHAFAVIKQGMGEGEYKAMTVWDNSPVTANYNLIFNGSYGGKLKAGTNDIIGNPLFIKPSEDLGIADFSIHAKSPAVNSASTNADHQSSQDFNETKRPLGGRPDRGAFESNHSTKLGN